MSIKWVAILVCVALSFAAGWHFGRQGIELKDAGKEVKVEHAQVEQDAKQLQVDTKAETTHDQEIEHPPKLVLSDPVWLHDSASCPLPVSTEATDRPASERGVDEGLGSDTRLELAQAFDTKYENALSGCRRMAAEWPQ